MKINNNIIVTQSGKKYEKPSILKNTIAILTANTVSGIVAKEINKIPQRHFFNTINSIASIEKDYFALIADKIFENSGLQQKGIKLIDAIKENEKEVNELWKKSYKIDITKLPLTKNLHNQVFKGYNALFDKKTKTILINKQKLSVALPHEIGHALNATGNGIGKILSKIRQPIARLGLIVFATALFKRKKVEGEETKGTFDKITTFIKDNCGKLTAFCFLPQIAEEALASKKGFNLIKNSTEINLHLNTVKKLNCAGLVSHMAMASIATLGVIVLSKIKDIITQPKEITE